MSKNVLSPTYTCFDDAVEFIEMLIRGRIDTEELKRDKRIVHAICLMPDGQRYSHAWVEDIKTRECVFCCVVNGERSYLVQPRNAFYKTFMVQETTKYTLWEAWEKNKATCCYGPWEEKYMKLAKDKPNGHAYTDTYKRQ